MKKKVYAFSGAVVLLCFIIFIGHSNIVKATTLFKFSNSTVPDSRIIINKETEARIQQYGKSFASWLNGNVPGGMVPSAATGVVLNDQLVFHHGVRADSNTRFGIASLSKTFTAVLALRLQEEKVISLDDPVTKYLPNVIIERSDLNSAPVTIKHLLSHTSGMPSFGSRYKTYEVHGKIISLPEQVHPTGYSYSYSNEGYVIIMHVIEAATGKSYAENIKEKILDPLEMTSSSAEQSNGTGGIISTIQDIAKYAVMLVNKGNYKGKTFLTEKSIEEMLAKPVELPHTKVDYHYSLSWEVITVDQHVDSYYKAGRWFNQASGLQIFPTRNIAFIYLCNPPEHLGDAFMSWRQGLTGMLRFLVRKISGDETLCTAWPYLTADELKWYEGKYRNIITGEKIQVSLRGGTLFSNGFGCFMPMRTFTSNRFLIDEGRMLHNFVWKENKVVGLALRHGYYELVSE